MARKRRKDVCYECQSRPKAPGRQRCETCLERVRADMARAVAAGLCRNCREPRGDNPTVLCEVCREKHNRRRKERYDAVKPGHCHAPGCTRKATAGLRVCAVHREKQRQADARHAERKKRGEARQYGLPAA